MLERLAQPEILSHLRWAAGFGMFSMLFLLWIGAIFLDITLSPAPLRPGQAWPNPAAAEALGMKLILAAGLTYWTLCLIWILTNLNAWRQSRRRKSAPAATPAAP